ncbi:hypothetical protein ACLOAV_008891 [Pseudogymnoascus australis]
MLFTPSNPRTIAANSGLGIKLTPNNSPYPRTPRSPNKCRPLYEAALSLKRIIGTTVSSPTGFDSLPNGNIFAYVAGAAVVVVQLEEDSQYSQRFFRAHPTAVPVIPGAATTPSTPINTANDSRNRTGASLRESAIGFSPSTPTTSRAVWSDSPLSKTWTSRERIKAATCLSISRDGRFLAVGETGYTPRVLIFNLQESSDAPLVILNEHTFGVTAVSFSPDGRYLATLGSPNDGFLYMWRISSTGAARLHASNKCTSTIKSMMWMGNSLITVGTRHVKVWRVEDNTSSSPLKQRFNLDGTASTPATVTRTLSGRNCLLGSLIDATFSCAASISETKAVVCSEKGHIALIDDNNDQNQLLKVAHVGFAVTCVSVDASRKLIRIGGRLGATKIITFDDLLTPTTPPSSPFEEDFNAATEASNGNLCAMSIINGHVVTVDSRHAIKIMKDGSEESGHVTPLTAHRGSVMGVRLLSPNSLSADFLSWDSAGNVIFWDLEGHCKGSFQVDLEQAGGGEEEVVNQCLVVRASDGGSFFVAGDKYGVIRILDAPKHTCSFVAKAHNSDVEDIAIFEGKTMTLLATSGRDRTVQLFKKMEDTWVLLQTMDEHTGSVTSVCFCDDGDKIISSSSDRTIQIRQIVTKEVGDQQVIAAIPIRVITLKATPVSMTTTDNDPSVTSVIVSMMDRTVATFDISTGKMLSTFKAADTDGNDAVVMDSLKMGKPMLGRPLILAGVSGTDKSVRIYDGSTGSFLDRGFGHTSSVTDVALLETPEQTTLISTGSDSTIMIWDLNTRTPEVILSPEPTLTPDDSSPPKELTSNMPPLRRVLSKAELAEFSRPSTATTPTGRTSPPRLLRRKTSKYSMNPNSPKLSMPPIPAMPGPYSFASSDDASSRRSSPRTRSRSPPPSPKGRSNLGARKASLVDLRGRNKSAGPASYNEFGSVNMATEQVCRTLRAYRKKLTSSETIKEDGLKELDQELRLTAQAVLEKSLKTRKISEAALAGLLDQYSERLVSIFDEKLRLSLKNSVAESREAGVSSSPEPMPQTARSKSLSGPSGPSEDTLSALGVVTGGR